MRIGSCHLWGADLGEFRKEVRLAGELGYDVIAIGDSPAGWHELYVSMAIAAQEAPRASVMPWVTSPFVRHPLATANSLCSLYDLTGGRVELGLATGGSNVMAIGQAPANQQQMRDYWVALNDLFDGKPATYDGKPVSPLHFPRKIPVHYSAFGPKALALAGELADGVILFTGSDLTQFDAKLAKVHEAARKAGRDPKKIKIFATSYCAVRDTRKAAINDLKAFIVVNGLALRTPEAMAQIPTEFRGKVEELQRRYDVSEHVVVGGKNTRLMDELGLTDFLAQFDTIAGTPDEVGKTMQALADRGVDTFVLNLPGHADPLGTLERLASIVKRLH